MPWRAPTVPFGLHGPGSGPVSRWLQEIADDFQPGHGLTLGPGAWSAEAVAFYAEPGTCGQWRRQAAALYPAFARTIVHDPDLRALVDAGKPFEGRLVDLLKLTVQDTRPDGGRAKVIDGITPAKVRRLRAYPEPLFESGADSYRHALRLLARLPLANVPATPEGWRALQGWPALMVTDLDRFGIPLETALAGLPEMWPRADLFQGQDVEAVQVGLRDMAIRCANTLLRPAHPAPVPRTDFIVIAMGLLFGGDSLARMARRQRDWHADLTRMNPILDDGLSLHWPALFAPFKAGGIEVRCLTSSAELDAEGGRGEDAKGMAGLDHCVGGYARSCHEGLSHIASVTAASPEGGRVRIATAELAVDRGRFSIRQLRGRSNQAPAREVLKAVDALVSALGDGSHPHDRYAAEIRESDDAPEVTTIDLPAVYEAWRPHLPAALRVSDPADFPDLLRERVRQFVELDEQETDSRLAQGGMAAG